MAVFALPNPKKNLTVDFPLDQVKKGTERIPVLIRKYKLHSSNAAFNQYTFEATEFMSFGVYIDINLSSLSDSKTDIAIEIRRKLGTFDTAAEVTDGNVHIQNMINAISVGIVEDDAAFEARKTQVAAQPKSGCMLFFALAIAFTAIIMLSI